MNRQVNLSTAATTATPVSTLIRTTAPVGAPHTTPSGRTSLPGILCVVIILDHQCNFLFFFTTILFVLLILLSHSLRKKYNTITHFSPPGAPQQPPDNVKKCKNFLSTLMKLAQSQPQQTVKNVRELIQGLIVR